MKAFKAFIKPVEPPQRSVKIKIYFFLFVLHRDRKGLKKFWFEMALNFVLPVHFQLVLSAGTPVLIFTLLAFTCLKSTMEISEQCVKSIQC